MHAGAGAHVRFSVLARVTSVRYAAPHPGSARCRSNTPSSPPLTLRTGADCLCLSPQRATACRARGRSFSTRGFRTTGRCFVCISASDIGEALQRRGARRSAAPGRGLSACVSGRRRRPGAAREERERERGGGGGGGGGGAGGGWGGRRVARRSHRAPRARRGRRGWARTWRLGAQQRGATGARARAHARPRWRQRVGSEQQPRALLQRCEATRHGREVAAARFGSAGAAAARARAAGQPRHRCAPPRRRQHRDRALASHSVGLGRGRRETLAGLSEEGSSGGAGAARGKGAYQGLYSRRSMTPDT